MEIILKQDISQLGKFGEVIKVKDGYARNFLIPKGLAVINTPANINIIEMKKRQQEAKAQRERQEVEALAKKLSNLSCSIRVRAGQDDRLYGSVTNEDIANALLDNGIQLDKRKIELQEPIKTLGVYLVSVKLYPSISANLKVWVVKE